MNLKLMNREHSALGHIKKRAAKVLKNQSGISLVYVLLSSIIVLVIAGSIVHAAASSVKTQYLRHDEQQAYFNAKSAAQIFTDEFVDCTVYLEKDGAGAITSAVPLGDGKLGDLMVDLLCFRNENRAGTYKFEATVEEMDTEILISFPKPGSFDLKLTFTGSYNDSISVIYAEYRYIDEWDSGADITACNYFLIDYSGEA